MLMLINLIEDFRDFVSVTWDFHIKMSQWSYVRVSSLILSPCNFLQLLINDLMHSRFVYFLWLKRQSVLALNYFSLPLTRPRNAARLILRGQGENAGEHTGSPLRNPPPGHYI
jgi:hypothetical protein